MDNPIEGLRAKSARKELMQKLAKKHDKSPIKGLFAAFSCPDKRNFSTQKFPVPVPINRTMI